MIGNLQPWAGERGKKGVINHPMNMIDPEQSGSDLGTGLAPREGFSEKVAEILERLPEENRVTGTITNVTKKEATDKAPPYYEIITDQGNVYAQKVVVAMGIGKHKMPDDFTSQNTNAKLMHKLTIEDEQIPLELKNLPRIMNMDQFQRLADQYDPQTKPLNEVIKSMIIIGPNVAIDIATTALRQNIEKV